MLKGGLLLSANVVTVGYVDGEGDVWYRGNLSSATTLPRDKSFEPASCSVLITVILAFCLSTSRMRVSSLSRWSSSASLRAVSAMISFSIAPI